MRIDTFFREPVEVLVAPFHQIQQYLVGLTLLTLLTKLTQSTLLTKLTQP